MSTFRRRFNSSNAAVLTLAAASITISGCGTSKPKPSGTQALSTETQPPKPSSPATTAPQSPLQLSPSPGTPGGPARTPSYTAPPVATSPSSAVYSNPEAGKITVASLGIDVAKFRGSAGVIITGFAIFNGQSPAQFAGLARGDVIRAIDACVVTTVEDYVKCMDQKKPGEVVNITCIRAGRVMTIKLVRLGSRVDLKNR